MMPADELSDLTMQLQKCLQKFQNLERCCLSGVEFTSHFKDSLRCLSACLASVQSVASQPHNKLYYGKLWLCISQVVKVLTLFRSLLSAPPSRQTVWYLSERLQWCVSELCRVLSGGGTDQDQDSAGSISFLHQMDQALHYLNNSDSEAWRLLLDDVVCHAVTVAKIASKIDYNEITSACHRLLEESSQLISCSDKCQVALLRDSLSACLTSLEQRVNTAVLRLLLQVFSEPSGPVKQLVRYCSQAQHPRHTSDLDPLVAQLDAHIERIILVAQFAISCCEDAGKRAAMRCCLASVESVDNYLVPALNAFYLTPTCVDKRVFAKALCDHWQDELASLQSHLDAIIDSYAFSLVVQDSMDILRKTLDGEIGEVLQTSQKITKHGWLLYKHLSTSCDVSITTVVLDQLKNALHRCETAVAKQVLPSVVVKLTKLVIDSVDVICEQLGLSSALQTDIDGSCADSPEVTVKSIRDLPLDISIQSTSNTQFNSYRPQWLKNKIREANKNYRSRILNLTEVVRKYKHEKGEVSISYTKTPKNLDEVSDLLEQEITKKRDLLTPYLSHKTERNTTLYVRTPRRLLQSHDTTTVVDTSSPIDVKDSHSLVLDITSILESLSSLANTLTSEKSDQWTDELTPPARDLKRYFSGESFNSLWFSQVPSDVNTPDRLQDLAFLDDKLKQLKATV